MWVYEWHILEARNSKDALRIAAHSGVFVCSVVTDFDRFQLGPWVPISQDAYSRPVTSNLPLIRRENIAFPFTFVKKSSPCSAWIPGLWKKVRRWPCFSAICTYVRWTKSGAPEASASSFLAGGGRGLIVRAAFCFSKGMSSEIEKTRYQTKPRQAKPHGYP